jgi:hypothetical protein
MEQSTINNLKTELLNDLVATTTVMEEVWRYHPDNSKKKDVVKEYDILKKIIKDIEIELKRLENIRN